MQVWIVLYGFDYEGADPVAVFSSKEAAEKWVADLVNECKDFGRNREYYKLLSFVVDEKANK